MNGSGRPGLLLAFLAIAIPATDAAAVKITYYTTGTSPYSIAAGRNGRTYWTDADGALFYALNSDPGTFHQTGTLDTSQGAGGQVVPGLEGKVWSVSGLRIGRDDPATDLSDTFPPTTDLADYTYGMTIGFDGDIYFTQHTANTIKKIDHAGTITNVKDLLAGTGPVFITLGPDGNLWFSEIDSTNPPDLTTPSYIGRLTAANAYTHFFVGNGKAAYGITSGPDGNLWFCEFSGGAIGKITTAGAITHYQIDRGPRHIVLGPDGNLWFTTYDNQNGGAIGRMTTSGAATYFPIDGVPEDITLGSDGAFWITLPNANKIARLVPEVPGDANGDGSVDVADVFYTINFLFAGGPPPK